MSAPAAGKAARHIGLPRVNTLLPKLQDHNRQQSRKSLKKFTQTVASTASDKEAPIKRGPLWSPLHRKISGPSSEMRATLLLRAQARTPLIKFIGKRGLPKKIDHTPHAHPASPTHSLPDSFANYRSKAQQHGPLGAQGPPQSSASSSSSSSEYSAPGPTSLKGSQTYGLIGGKTGAELGSVQPGEGEFFDRSELPRRFKKLAWTEEEMEAVETGGASSIKPQLSYHHKS